MATLAELTGQQVAATDGISFLPTLLGKKQPKHDYLYFEYPEKGGQLAIRMGEWKGVKTNLKKSPKKPWQLYNLKTDRNETTDVAAQNPGLLKKFDVIVKKEHQEPTVEAWQFLGPVIGN
ncbi:hypothetical protein [Dyadobacter sp.]|uniref:hypothetical protein n=1 Tax=Dyadobacter sp. TaxID=1914288 RepID=UPI003F72A37C